MDIDQQMIDATWKLIVTNEYKEFITYCYNSINGELIDSWKIAENDDMIDKKECAICGKVDTILSWKSVHIIYGSDVDVLDYIKYQPSVWDVHEHTNTNEPILNKKIQAQYSRLCKDCACRKYMNSSTNWW